MASQADSNDHLVPANPNAKPRGQAAQANGYFTPEGTPEPSTSSQASPRPPPQTAPQQPEQAETPTAAQQQATQQELPPTITTQQPTATQQPVQQQQQQQHQPPITQQPDSDGQNAVPTPKEPAHAPVPGSQGNGWTQEQEEKIMQILRTPDGFNNDILGVTATTDPALVKQTYKKAALLIHPDKCKHPKAQEAFQKLQGAAEHLKIMEEIKPTEEFYEGDPMDLDAEPAPVQDRHGYRVVARTVDKIDVAVASVESAGRGASESPTQPATHDRDRKDGLFVATDASPDARAAVPSMETDITSQNSPAKQPHGAESIAATNKEWSWPTGLTANEERIMAYRTHGKGHRCWVETDASVPIYQIRSGASCGRLEVEKYLQLPGIRQLPRPKTRDWSFKQRSHFEEITCLALSEYGTHNPFSKTGRRRDPESWCGVKWSWGYSELPTSDLRKVLGRTSADTKIRDFCAKYNRIPPMDLKPNFVLEKPEEKGAYGMQPGVLHPKPEDSNEVSPPREDIKPPAEVDEKAILDKVDQRLANLEKRLEEQLTALIAALSASGKGA